MKKFILFILFFTIAIEAKPKVDCTLISNDFAIYMQRLMRVIRTIKPPTNSCGVRFNLRVGINDASLRDGKEIDLKNRYDFYLRDIEYSLKRYFIKYNMGFNPKSVAKDNAFSFHAGAWEKKYVAPASIVLSSSGFTKKIYNSNKPKYLSIIDENEILLKSDYCNLYIRATLSWIVSEPQNSISGFVNKIDKEGNKKKLKRGKVKFTRLGPNDTKDSYESKIKDGFYKTKPKLPSGHYRVELIEPKECKQLVDGNWIFKSGEMLTKSFDVKCEEKKNYFTAIVKQKTININKPYVKFRGIDKPLKSISEDRNVYYFYIDEDKGVINQLHIDKYSTRYVKNQKYILDNVACKYDIVTKDYLVKYLGGGFLFDDEDNGWGIDDNTILHIKLSNAGNKVALKWRDLKNKRYFYKKGKITLDMPKIAKDFYKQKKNLHKQYMNMEANSKEMKVFKSLFNMETDKKTKCEAYVSFESAIGMPINPDFNPKVEYEIKIRESTQKEINYLKEFIQF
jgi:hypothetical protein